MHCVFAHYFHWQRGNEWDFAPSTLVLPCPYYSTNVPYSSSSNILIRRVTRWRVGTIKQNNSVSGTRGPRRRCGKVRPHFFAGFKGSAWLKRISSTLSRVLGQSVQTRDLFTWHPAPFCNVLKFKTTHRSVRPTANPLPLSGGVRAAVPGKIWSCLWNLETAPG